MEQFIRNANPGLERRFTTKLHIEDYTPDQLVEIFMLNAKKNRDILTNEAISTLKELVAQMVDAKRENFGNAGEMVKLLEQADTRRANRLMARDDQGELLPDEAYHILEAEDIPYDPPKVLNEEDIFRELNQLIGLNNVKQEIKEIADYIRVERKKAEDLGKKFKGVDDHYLFVGNPGTGKTTVARIMADIFHALDVLPTNKLVEVKREDLVMGYVGQTAPNTKEKVKSAIGGVFFIDEAYSLKSEGSGDFGQEATNTLLPLMLDYKGKMVFIAAGYPREIQQWINTNSGLESRFTKTIHFEDYTGEELARIFQMKASNDQLHLTPEADLVMKDYFNSLFENRSRNFANAREVGNYFNRVKRKQSSRLEKRMHEPDFDKNEYKELRVEDFPTTD
jgi:SpoVK/Ycf46/Vps4 family AAA+-type ATPase